MALGVVEYREEEGEGRVGEEVMEEESEVSEFEVEMTDSGESLDSEEMVGRSGLVNILGIIFLILLSIIIFILCMCSVKLIT